jgi:hypothetical protein
MQKLTPRQQDVLRLLAKEGAYINCKRQGTARRWNCYLSQSIPPDANNKQTRVASLGATTIELVDALQQQGLIGIRSGAQYFDSEWVITKAGLALLGLTVPENAAYEPRVYGFYRLARPDRHYQVTDRRDGTLIYSGSETIALMMAKALSHPFTDEHRSACTECNAPDTFDHSAPQPSTLAGISDPEPDTAWCNNCKAQVAIEPCDNFQAAGQTLVCKDCGSADLNFNATFTTYPTPEELGRAQEAVKGIQQAVVNHIHAESDIPHQRALLRWPDGAVRRPGRSRRLRVLSGWPEGTWERRPRPRSPRSHTDVLERGPQPPRSALTLCAPDG